MKLQDIKQQVFSELEPFATSNGFRMLKGRFALIRKQKDRIDEILFLTNSWGFEVHIFPQVSVDFNEIRTICNKCGFHLNFSAFINLRLLEEIKRHDFHDDLPWQMQVTNTDRFILTDDNLDYNLLNKKISSLMSLALDFLAKYSSISAIDSLFNTKPLERYCPYRSGLDTHCMIGIIAAKLSNNSEYEEIKQMYQNIVMQEDFLEKTKDSFYQVIDYLDQL